MSFSLRTAENYSVNSVLYFLCVSLRLILCVSLWLNFVNFEL